MKRIYVGNLSFGVTEDELHSLFAAYGGVRTVNLPKDPFTGRTKGFGFVEMPNDDEGEKAITALNGARFKGRTMIVNQARHRPERRAS